MTKKFCDLCDKEITLEKENSVYVFIEWRMLVDKGMQPFQKQEEYCDECTVYVKHIIENRRKKVETSKSNKK